MNLFKRKRADAQAVAAATQRAPQAETSPKANRRELLRVVLRDTLQRHGIPTDWIGAELLASTLSNGEHGLHWRLLIKHWEPRLLAYSVAIEDALLERLTSLDPTADRWLTGMSWQFAVKDRASCPELPRPGTWTGGRRAGPVQGAAADVESARADLNRWLSKRETEMPRSPDTLPPTWAPTQPAKY